MLVWQLVVCADSVNINLQLNAVPRSNNEATDSSTEMPVAICWVEPRQEVYAEDGLKVRWNRLYFIMGPKISGDSQKLLGKLMATNDTIDICIWRPSSWMCTVKRLVLGLLHRGDESMNSPKFLRENGFSELSSFWTTVPSRGSIVPIKVAFDSGSLVLRGSERTEMRQNWKVNGILLLKTSTDVRNQSGMWNIANLLQQHAIQQGVDKDRVHGHQCHCSQKKQMSAQAEMQRGGHGQESGQQRMQTTGRERKHTASHSNTRKAIDGDRHCSPKLARGGGEEGKARGIKNCIETKVWRDVELTASNTD
ncbi:hypothetical protein B0H19DRAFT_1338305 [Mycena capillaripes]|nr:hypothetical protein B0H19DRAFT_1338305 [Mycena capillaripes]